MGDIAQPDEAVNEMLADVGMTVAAGGGKLMSRTPRGERSTPCWLRAARANPNGSALEGIRSPPP
jgi:hypothetical protein